MRERINALLDTLYHPALRVIDPRLDRVEGFLAGLGNPQNALPPVVHVAGTNGKGSVIAYLRAMLEAAGYRVHRYISPHLVRFNERILLAGEEIEDAMLLGLLQRVKREAEAHPVTFFEATTAAAFLAFKEARADILLLETGMGGRLDATNVIARPALTVITSIGMDHEEFLGNTLEAVAGEKAGILKPGAPCVVAGQEREALETIEQWAVNKRAGPLLSHGREWRAEARDGELRFEGKERLALPLPALPGSHQIMNAGVALACAEALEGFALSAAHKAEGLRRASWPGRLQRLRHASWLGLLPEGSALWLDGGHNPQAGAALAEWLAEQTQGEKYIVAGMVEKKDSRGFFAPFAGVVEQARTIAIPGEALSQGAEPLAAAARGAGLAASHSAGLEQALGEIGKTASGPASVLICGSLYLAGAVLKRMN